jgi:hypothetical protein
MSMLGSTMSSLASSWTCRTVPVNVRELDGVSYLMASWGRPVGRTDATPAVAS